jgi:hypothetical protein
VAPKKILQVNSNENYFSFLFCVHSDHIDLYINGLEIGKIRNNTFYPCELNSLSGPYLRTFEMLDLPRFIKTQYDLKDFLQAVTQKIQIPEKPLKV